MSKTKNVKKETVKSTKVKENIVKNDQEKKMSETSVGSIFSEYFANLK